MLGDIDYSKKPYRPNYFLAKPNKQIIGKLSEAYKDNLKDPVVETSELTLSVPYFIDVNHVLTLNKHVDMIKENYLIKLVFGKTSEWFMITSINEVMNDSSSYKQITLLGLEFELAQRVLKGYTAESKGARTVLTEMLNETTWTIGDIDPDFELSKRSFEFLDNKLLGAIYDVANTYNAIVQFDTNLQTVGLKKPELFGIDMGLTFSYESILKSFDKKSDANELVTRLHLKGKDGLTINAIHPTGKDYLEDYSYFMYPFSRDVNKKVIEHSYSMSDSLCHAILDYQELVEANKNQFTLLKTARDGYVTTLSKKQSELVDLQNQLKVIYSIVDNYQLGNNNKPTMFFESVAYTGTTKTVNFDSLQTMYPYAVMAKVSNATNVQVSLNGSIKTIISNTWTLLGKVNGVTTSSVLAAGSGLANVDIQVTSINEAEYNTSFNDVAIIERYCPNNKQMQIDVKKSEIAEQTNYLNTILAQIISLQSLLSSANNFTPDQLIELQRFVKIGTYENSNCVDAEDLLKAGEENFAEVKVPQMSMEIDIVYFLNVMAEQSKWDKLNKGDYISIKYERIGVNVKAKIIEINYDFEGEKISLTLSNVRNDGTAATKMNEFMKKSSNTSTTIDANKKDWLKSVTDVSDMSILFDQFWDSVTNQINMSINETVTIDNRGILLYDPNDSNRFLKLTHGAIGMTKSNGNKWETGITADGIISESLYGKIILSQRVIVGDAAGIWLMEGPRTTIKDRYGRIAMMLGLYNENPDKYGMIINRYNGNSVNSTLINKVIADSDDGFKIQRFNGHSFVDVFNVDTNGFLYSEDMTTKRLKILSDQNELLLDSYTKEMNLGKFTDIITDGKLTGIEKLQVLGERERIISEYKKLLDQANIYKSTSRDDTVRIDIPPFTASYNALIAYLEPLLSNMTITSDIDRDEFIQMFKAYYDQVVRIVNAINDSIKYSSLQLGSLYNSVLIDALDGVTVTRSDEMYRTRMNATDGISIEKQVNGNWIKKFYINAEDSRLWVEELVAKKLTIVNDFNDVFLDIDSSYLDIGRFTTIITDNKLTSIEKLTLKQEWQTIQTEYVKLLQQANQYKTSQRDNYTKVLIDIPPFTTAFNNLTAYVIPLLLDMSATTDIDRDEFSEKFQRYYNEAQRIINEITDAVKWSSLQFGSLYNGTIIDALNGITVTRSDDLYRTRLNATDGISIEKNINGNWIKKFYVSAQDSRLWAEELVAKKLTIVDDHNTVMLDINTSYLDIGRFTTIITDNKLTSIEKLTLKQEWQTIQTEYVKLLQQANQYRTSQRDNYQTVLVDIPPFTAAYADLATYITPLLADMSVTTDIDREVFANTFQAYYNQVQRIINEITNAVKWGSLQLGQDYNKTVIDALNGITVTRGDNVVVTRLNATEGISISRHGDPVFFADTEGKLHAIDLIAKRLKLTTNPFGGATDDVLLLDAENRIMYMDRWDLVGASRINTEMLEASIVSAEFGFISDLTAQRLSTMTRSAIGSWANYINIEKNSIDWITGIAVQGAHKTLSDGRPLYWVNSSETGRMTTEVTSWPVYEYAVDNSNKKIKARFYFDGEGDAANPAIDLGIGDGTPNGAKAKISKYGGGLKIGYNSSNYGLERSADFKDDGILFNNTSGATTFATKDFIVMSTNGTIKIGNGNAYIELTVSGAVNVHGTQFNFIN